MKETTKRGWAKVGYLCLTFVPLILYAFISFATATVVSILVAVRGILAGAEDMYSYILEKSMSTGMISGCIYALIGIVCLGLWYYFGCKRKQIKPKKAVLNPVNLILLAVLAFCMQYVTNLLMLGIDAVLPKAMESYEQLIELAGIGEVTFFGVLYGVILGPVAEELTFRGVTLYYAQKATKRFWLANILQALAFGIMHMNLVQGIYAFVLGLAMGYIYKKFRSLYAVIWFHICFNFLAYGPLVFFDGLLPENVVFRIIWSVLMCAFAVLLLWLLARRTNGEKHAGLR